MLIHSVLLSQISRSLFYWQALRLIPIFHYNKDGIIKSSYGPFGHTCQYFLQLVRRLVAGQRTEKTFTWHPVLAPPFAVASYYVQALLVLGQQASVEVELRT